MPWLVTIASTTRTPPKSCSLYKTQQPITDAPVRVVGPLFTTQRKSARSDAPFSDNLITAYEAEEGDLRFTTLTQFNEDSTRLYTTKFPDAVNNSDNVPLIRITEVYLNRAEALAELNGVNQESLTLINTLRARAGLEAFTTGQFASVDAFIDAILNERRKELAFEGYRRMDTAQRENLANIKNRRRRGPTG